MNGPWWSVCIQANVRLVRCPYRVRIRFDVKRASKINASAGRRRYISHSFPAGSWGVSGAANDLPSSFLQITHRLINRFTVSRPLNIQNRNVPSISKTDCRAGAVEWTSWAYNVAPGSCNLGIECRLIGATLVLDVTRVTCVSSLLNSALMYSFVKLCSLRDIWKPMNLMRMYGCNARLRLCITLCCLNVFRTFKSFKNNFQVANSSPSSTSSQLTFLIQRLWKRIFMWIVNGDSIPIGSKIFADNLRKDHFFLPYSLLITRQLSLHNKD